MKTALVTGGSRGIGRAISLKLASMGYFVLINYRSNETEAKNCLESLLANGGTGELLKFDVSNTIQTKECLEAWIASHPENPIEILVNNAGITKDMLMVQMEWEDWNSVIQTNLNSFYNVTKPVLQGMVRKRYGRIINIVSLAGVKGNPGQVNYAATKAGIIGATKSLGLELAKRNITVNAVAPGFISTDMTSALPEAELKGMIPMNRFGKPEEVASLVGYLASPEASYITAEVINVNGGLYS
ncbi:MAG: 3-oxoacyl-ACP reductase FabG [Bacteroidia bacterium]|nr:3-oxoacyl-ACP reductase FabG [Bacteroidia bacterium]